MEGNAAQFYESYDVSKNFHLPLITSSHLSLSLLFLFYWLPYYSANRDILHLCALMHGNGHKVRVFKMGKILSCIPTPSNLLD